MTSYCASAAASLHLSPLLVFMKPFKVLNIAIIFGRYSSLSILFPEIQIYKHYVKLCQVSIKFPVVRIYTMSLFTRSWKLT